MARTLDIKVSAAWIPWQSPECERVRSAWDYLLAQDRHAPVFVHRMWFELAAQAGSLKPQGVLLVRGDAPIAVFPLCRPFPGCWEVPSHFGAGDLQAVIDPAWETQAWAGLAAWVRQAPGVGLLSLGICEDRGRIDRCVTACQAHGLFVKVRPQARPAVWTTLPPTWDAFLRQVGTKAAHNIRRAERKLRELGDDCTAELLTSPEACADAIPDLARLYRLRWGTAAPGSLFADPRSITFYREAVRWAAACGSAMVFLVRLRGEPMLIQTVFHMPGQDALYQHLTARNAALTPDGISPGIVGSAVEFRWAIEHGLARVNQGPVLMPYKAMFGGEAHPRWQVSVARSQSAHAVLESLQRGMRLAQHLPAHAAQQVERVMRRCATLR